MHIPKTDSILIEEVSRSVLYPPTPLQDSWDYSGTLIVHAEMQLHASKIFSLIMQHVAVTMCFQAVRRKPLLSFTTTAQFTLTLILCKSINSETKTFFIGVFVSNTLHSNLAAVCKMIYNKQFLFYVANNCSPITLSSLMQ